MFAKLMESTDSNIQAAAAKILRKIGGVSDFGIDNSVVPVRLEIGNALGRCLDMENHVSDQPTSTDRKNVDRGPVAFPMLELVFASLNMFQDSLYLCHMEADFQQPWVSYKIIPSTQQLAVSSVYAPLRDAVCVTMLAQRGLQIKSFFISKALHVMGPLFPPIMSLVGLLESPDQELQDAASDTLSKFADHG